MMAQGYPRPTYSTGSTILPPLQRNRSYPAGTNGTGTPRAYFDPPSPSATPILPSQMAPEGDRYGTAFDPSGSPNGTPQ